MMRTITLELLRHGPAHNQLLSPLTDYLALCENHSAISLRVPFEHNQLTHRLRALSYKFGTEPRSFQLVDTAQVLGELLGQIPGLTADLNRHLSQSGESETTHLRLIISASELALLPFELALAPPGFPGAGQYLTLQPQNPLCITRETGRVANQYLVWPKRPKILFAFASPSGYEPVPAEAHLLALRQAIAPWLALSEHTNSVDREKLVTERLTVLPNATVATLEQACAVGNFTHIHILAHGTPLEGMDETRYGLVLHAKNETGKDIISGARLATILQAQRENAGQEPNRLAVVTLASCNGSNIGSVTGIGASISHDLHEGGIPLVIASQFPLSFAGSVMMVEKLYNGLLWGKDPRELMIDLRRSLHSHFSNRHDWASLTVYTSLPPDFDQQLAIIRVELAKQSINAALRRADLDLQGFLNLAESEAEPTRLILAEEKLHAVLDHIGLAQQPLMAIMREYPAQREKILAKLAGVSKRNAQLQFHVGLPWLQKSEQERTSIINCMHESRKYYWETRFMEPTEAYKTVQYLALTMTLKSMGHQLPIDDLAGRQILQLWLSAELQALNAETAESNQTRAWAYCDLAELYLLAPLIPDLSKIYKDDNFHDKAVDAASKITIFAGRSSYHNFSTRRQIHRYISWFAPMMPPNADGIPNFFCSLIRTAQAMLEKMPEGQEPEWDG